MIGTLLISGMAAGQDATRTLERAQSLATNDPAEALRLVTAAVDAGIDRWDAHFLRASLLLRTGNPVAARAALAKSQACLARDGALTEELLRRIDLGAGSKGAPTPEIERNAGVEPPGDPAITSDTPPDVDGLRREADVLLSESRIDEATDRYFQLAQAVGGSASDYAKDRMVSGVKALAERAQKIGATDPAAAQRNLDGALRHATELRDILDDPDRSLEAMGAVAESGNDATRDRVGQALVDWVRDYLARARAAEESGDSEGARRLRTKGSKTLVKLFGLDLPDEFRSAAFRSYAEDGGAHFGNDDIEQNRRVLEDQVAWLKRLVREGEQALQAMDKELAKRKFKEVERSENLVYLMGYPLEAAEIAQSLAESSDEEASSAARKRLEERHRTLAQAGRKAEQAGDISSAARLLASAYWQMVSDWQLGLDAAALHIREGQPLEATRIYERILQVSDGEAITAVRQQIADLRHWATKNFLANQNAYETALKEKRPAEAFGIVEASLVIFDRAKWNAVKAALRDGLDIRDIMGDMTAGLAAGRFPELTDNPPAGPPDPIERALESDTEFTAALGMRMIPAVAGGSRPEHPADPGSRGAMWISADTIGDEQIVHYWALLRSPRGDDEVTVSWNHAVMFCLYATQRERDAGRLPPGYAYSLPTEAEWEQLHATVLQGEHAHRSDPAPFEWCLDRVDEHGVDWNARQSGTGFQGKYRICRSTDPALHRAVLPPYSHQGKRVLFRVVLAKRPELAAPISKPR